MSFTRVEFPVKKKSTSPPLVLQAPGSAQHAMHSQHGFHVKSSCSSSQFPTIQEASLAEERGDSLGPAGGEQRRIDSSQAVPPARVGTGVKGLLDMCADSTMTVATSQGLQLSGSPVEVVGTVHNSTGVRRLVKAVVRGLRACQVCKKYTLFLRLFVVVCLCMLGKQLASCSLRLLPQRQGITRSVVLLSSRDVVFAGSGGEL